MRPGLGLSLLVATLCCSGGVYAPPAVIQCESKNLPCGCPTLAPSNLIQKASDLLSSIAAMATHEDSEYYFIDDMAFRKADLRVPDATMSAPAEILIHAFWPGGIIFFDIDAKFSVEYRKRIQEAMAAIQDSVSTDHLEFRPARTSKGELCRKSYLYVEKTNVRKCEAEIGMQVTMKTMVWLNEDACSQTGVIIHELLHSLGRYHEQCRPDRDLFVELKANEIAQSACDNFEKLVNFYKMPDPTLVVPYDVNSIMHYDSCAFSCRGNPTMMQKSRLDSVPIKLNRDYITALDVEKLRIMFPVDAKVPYRSDFCKSLGEVKDGETVHDHSPGLGVIILTVILVAALGLMP